MFHHAPFVALVVSAFSASPYAPRAQAPIAPTARAESAHRAGSIAAGQLLVRFHTERSREALGVRDETLHERLAQDVAPLGGRVVQSWGIVPAALLRIDARHMARVAALPYVASVDYDRWHEPRIRTATDSAHHAADVLQARGLRGAGATIACVDTGFDSAYAGSPPHANAYPALPSDKRLPPNTDVAFRVSVGGGQLDGVALWGASTAATSAPLAIAVSRDNNGRPDATPFARGSLRLGSQPDFVTARLQPTVQLARGTTIWIQFRTPADTSGLYLEVDAGDATPAYIGSQLASLDLAWKLVENGRSVRPHMSFADASAAARRRLRVHRQLGALRAPQVEAHGTMLAAIAGGRRWNSANADAGHAPEARLALYACADDQAGNARTSTLLTAVDKLLCDVPPIDVEVVLFGYSGSPDPRDLLQRALDSLARNTDVVVVVPAGNAGSDLSTSHVALNTIAVGAANANKQVAAFSGRGAIANMAYPDLVAHGVGVVGPQSDAEAQDFVASGTSLAAAQVAGAAAQLRADRPELSALETRAILLAGSGASPGTGSTFARTGPGAGYLRNDLAYAISQAVDRSGLDRITKTRNTWRRSVPVQSGQLYQFAVCWERLDNKTSVSNLDLVLRDGNGLAIARSVQSAGTQEFVRMRASRDDTWSVEVSAASFDEGVVKIAFASSLPFGGGNGTARYSENGTGCKGSGTGGGCPAMKQDPKDLSFCPALPPKTSHAIVVQCPCPVTMNGFDLYSKASLPNTPMECFLWKATPSLEPELVPAASGVMTLQTTEGYYKVVFSSPVFLDVDEASHFFIGFRTPGSGLVWADNGTEHMGHHFEMPAWWPWWIGGAGFEGAITKYAWDWKTDCTPDATCPGGPPPVIYGVGLPIVGSRNFGVGLEQGLANSVGILLTGIETRCIGLKAIGAQACSLCCNTVFNVGIPVDARGGAQVILGVPQDRNLVGASFANQWVLLDQRANGLGLTLSGHGRGVIGTR